MEFDRILLLTVIGAIVLLLLTFFKSGKKVPKEDVYVYIIENTYLHDTKIGISNRPEKRIKQLQTGSSRPLKIQYTVKFTTRDEATKVEYQLHKKFSKHRLTGEWFDIDYRKVIKYIDDKYKK